MKNKNKLIYPVILIVIAILSLVFKYFVSGNRTGLNILNHSSETSVSHNTQDTSLSTKEISTETTETSEPVKCQVYICGAINNPGIYEANTGEILNSIIEKSGNFTDDAAKTRINLVYQINNNMTIYIPTNKELDSNIYDNSLNQEGIIIGTTNNQVQNNTENPTISSNNSNLININKANEDELSSLPGIGPSLAQKIIKYREKQPFKNKDDLMNVSGIGNAKYNNLKDFICT